MDYLAVRSNSDEVVVAHMTCDNVNDHNEFTDKLTEGITDWINNTESGRKAWEGNNEDLNFGDLSFYHDGELDTYLRKAGIEGFQIKIIDSYQALDFDMCLKNDV